MTSANQRFITLVGTDFSDLAQRALDDALEAACLHHEAEVHLAYVQPEVWIDEAFSRPLASATSADETLERLQRHASDRVSALGSRLDPAKLKRVVVHLRHGSPAEQIAQLAAQIDADLVVVGSHGQRGVQRLFLGSVAERVAHLARCPVWIVRPKDHPADERVPRIEPPCSDCLRKREETAGAVQWCAHHAEHHLRPHRYSYASNGIYAAESVAYEATPEGR